MKGIAIGGIMGSPRLTRRFVLGGSAVLLTALGISGCTQEDNQLLTVAEDGKFFGAGELTILQDVTEIMIPKTATPGAIDAQVASFVDAMMETWAGTNTKASFKNLLVSINARAVETYEKPYVKLSLEDRTTLIEAIDTAAFQKATREEGADYRHFKELVFHIFYTSEEASRDYVPIPGMYKGNLTLEEYEELMDGGAYGR